MSETAKIVINRILAMAVESARNEGIDIYIDGEPVSDEFDIDGIDLDKYNIRIEDDVLYLMSSRIRQKM